MWVCVQVGNNYDRKTFAGGTVVEEWDAKGSLGWETSEPGFNSASATISLDDLEEATFCLLDLSFYMKNEYMEGTNFLDYRKYSAA